MRMLAILVLALSLNSAASVASPVSFAQSDPFTIYPGIGVGAVRLGMNVKQDVVPLLGAWKSSEVGSDGTRFYQWFTTQTDSSGAHRGGGIGMYEDRGVVQEIYIYHDPRYTIRGVGTGSGEAQVKSALGEPLRVTTEDPRAQGYMPPKDLVYTGLLLVVGQTPTDPDGDYQKVFEIHVTRP